MTDYFDPGAYFVSTAEENDTIARVRWMNGPRTSYDALDAAIHAMGVLPVKEKHILDIKYPHVCFKCKKPLFWSELYDANTKPISINEIFDGDYKIYKKLKNLWRSQVIEFYCCHCYDSMVSFP